MTSFKKKLRELKTGLMKEAKIQLVSAAVFMVWVVLLIKPTKKELPSKTRQNVLVPRNKGFSL